MYASTLYELKEVNFNARRSQLNGDDNTTTHDENEERWTRFQVAFAMLKNQIAAAPILRYFDLIWEAVIIVYASEWTILTSLVQDHEGQLMPVTSTSRTLKANELNYSMVKKEVMALLHILETCFTMLVTLPHKFLTRRSTLAWLGNLPICRGA